jgi:hypothetical protein
MNRIAMSPAASALLRLLVGRARVRRDRILLTSIVSSEWRSLTLTGERHQIVLRVPRPNSGEIAERMCDGLEDAEFCIPGTIVADIAVRGEAKLGLDGSTSLVIEALTVSED